MGCFNVCCSISNLSIDAGDKIVFIPLIPNNYEGENLVGTQSNLIYANCYFNPFSLPIIGQYDDYGSVELIEKNENTKVVGNMFNISIEDLLKL